MKYVCPKCSETKIAHRKERNVMCPKCETVRMFAEPGSGSKDIENSNKSEENSSKNMKISNYDKEEKFNEEKDFDKANESMENEIIEWVCPGCIKKKKTDISVGKTKCPTCGRAMEMTSESVHKKVRYEKRSGVDKSGKNKKIGRLGENKEESRKEKEGYVYVLVSSEKPGIVKIGVTGRNPEKRAEELSSSTGVAMPYIVAYKTKTAHAEKVEKAVHERLSDKRVNPDREFFKVKTARAIEIIEEEK